MDNVQAATQAGQTQVMGGTMTQPATTKVHEDKAGGGNGTENGKGTKWLYTVDAKLATFDVQCGKWYLDPEGEAL